MKLCHIKIASKYNYHSRRIQVIYASLDKDQIIKQQKEEEKSLIRAKVTRRIRDHGKLGQMKAAVNELSKMLNMGVELDTKVATAVVDVFVKKSKMDVAETIFNDLFGEYVIPDDVTFCSLIRGYGELNPPNWNKINEILEKMTNDYKIDYTLSIYNALIEICARTNDLERAENYVDAMASDGISPNSLTLSLSKKRKSIRALIKKINNLNN